MALQDNVTVELYTHTLYSGMKLKGDCFDSEGNRVIDASKPVTQEEIDAIIAKKIPKIFYTTTRMHFKNDVETAMISDQQINKTATILEDIYYKIKTSKTTEIHRKVLDEVVDGFFKEMQDNDTAFLNLIDVAELDDYTYSHSINVTMMSMFMAEKINMDREKIYELGVSSLLFDIGKSMVPKDLLHKTGSLSPEELKIIRQHPVYGYNLLKNQPGMSEDILNGVLLHHENYQGGGYPFGFKFNKIPNFAQILAITDTFDAASTDHGYKPARPLNEVFEIIMKDAGTKFNPFYAHVFLKVMSQKLNQGPLFPMDSYVLLNSGEIGYVIGSRRDDPYTLRPIINIIFNPNQTNKILKYHQQIDLEGDVNRSIVRRVENRATVEKLIKIRCKGDTECEIDEKNKL